MSITTAGPILVTGGFDFLGRLLIQDLINHQVPPDHIHVFARKANGRPKISGVKYHEGDLEDPRSIEDVLTIVKPTIIFHTASPRVFMHTADEYIRANVDGTRALIKTAQAVGTRAFVYTSSTSIMEDGVHDLKFVDETAPVQSLRRKGAPYQYSKALGDALVLELNDQGPSRMLIVSLRTVGKGDEQHLERLVDYARTGRSRYQLGDGSNLFDYVYVENLTQVHILAAEALLRAHAHPTSIPSDMAVAGEAFCITNNEPMPFWSFVRLIAAVAGYPVPLERVVVVPFILGLTLGSVLDWTTWIFSLGFKRSFITSRAMKYTVQQFTFSVDKAKKRLAYKPIYSIEAGIRKSVLGSVGAGADVDVDVETVQTETEIVK